jgi:hypothetical protein
MQAPISSGFVGKSFDAFPLELPHKIRERFVNPLSCRLLNRHLLKPYLSIDVRRRAPNDSILDGFHRRRACFNDFPHQVLRELVYHAPLRCSKSGGVCVCNPL